MAVNHAGNAENQILLEEHEGVLFSHKVTFAQTSYYKNTSLASGYTFHGLTIPKSNPTTAMFRIMRENLTTGDFLFGDGDPAFIHIWSSVSLASITYS